MKIYNSLTKKIEEFKPITEGKISMYVCGPTVYNYAHVGNMRPVIFFDTVYRYFKYLGYDVTYASNFTDVDDKIINAALELGVEEKEITEKFIKIYLDDIHGFNCLDVDKRPRVTESMDSIIEFIDLLLKKEYAYKSGEDVYFRSSKVKTYGSLSGQNTEELEHGKRIEVKSEKESPNDFVLWKKTNAGITWNAPFGTGRPGWHTECVVMINKIFGNNIDIHGGGSDLRFPHHENEMAQANAAWGTNLANYWMHNNMVKVNGEKMSKSLGNFLLAKDLKEKYSSNTIRLGMFKTHYRMPLDFTTSLFNEAKTIDDKINNALKQAKIKIDLQNLETNKITRDEKIEESMNDDFNTSNLITYILQLVKDLNASVRNNDTNISQIYDKISLSTNILGLKYNLKDLTEEEKETYNNWEKARKNKDFDSADKYRNILIEKNIL